MSEDLSQPLRLIEGKTPFYESLHVAYIEKLAEKLDASMEGAVTEHLRMSGVYWSLTALHILREPQQVNKLMGFEASKNGRRPILDWMFDCFDPSSGGFAGNIHQDGHLLYTLSALQILALQDKLDDDRLDRESVIQFIVGLQQPDGSFAGDKWGEIDTRFSYCALSALSILGSMTRIDRKQAVDYILQCRNMDGGFGSIVGAESHAGQGE
jgi:geranylgeranyl transferase type-2 subunit beta